MRTGANFRRHTVLGRGAVGSIVSVEDVHRVLHTAISPRGSEDRLTWGSNKSGKCSVKTAYQLSSELGSDQQLEIEGRWNLLWGLKVPPKV